MSTTAVADAAASVAPPVISEAWNRTGFEQLKLEEDEALLSGWHQVIRWFLSFLLSTPRDAIFLRRMKNTTDMIETMDLFLQFEPRLFLVTLSGIAYMVAGLFGSIVYVQLRRRKRCGGDLTQDINENMRCILQVYTAAYIVVLAGILLGSLLMLASLFELGQSVASEGASLETSLREVVEYIGKANLSQVNDNIRRVHVLKALAQTLEKDFRHTYTVFAVPHVVSVTSAMPASAVMDLQSYQDDPPPVIEEQQLQALPPGVTPEVYMASFVAERIVEVYNLTITDTVHLAKETCTLATDFSHMLIMDADITASGFDKLQPALEAADTLGVMKTLRSESKSYVAGIVGSFSVLFVLYSGSFIMGMFYYNEGVAPTKRSASSNYAGLAMLLAVVLSFPICSILMLVTVSLMPLALTLTNYVCRPYENIIYETADITHISLLDDTMRVIWPWNRRGKWFGNFLAGSTLTICNGGRMLEVIKGDYQDSVNTLAEQTFTVQQLLLSLTVDPRLIFSVDHPELKFFEKMKSQLWDHVDKITEKFILWILRDVNDLVHTEHAGNPPCFAAYKGYEKSLGILCRGIIRNVNAFWTALGFCLWMFLLLGTVSHFLSKYFLRMVNWTYDGSEVESYTSTSSSSSSKSDSKDGTSSPKAGAGKEEAKATVPGDHPVAVEPVAGAEPHKETSKEGPKEGPKELQPAAVLSPGSPSKEQRTLPRWMAKGKRVRHMSADATRQDDFVERLKYRFKTELKSICTGAGTLRRMQIDGQDDTAAASSAAA